jgi:hypothetical protein
MIMIRILLLTDGRIYDKVVKIAESGQAKKHVFCSDGRVAGKGCKTLACVLAVMVLWPLAWQLTARRFD